MSKAPQKPMKGEKVIPPGKKPTPSTVTDAVRGAVRESLGKPKK